MPYHYQTGTAANAKDLKTSFVNFCVNTVGSFFVEQINNNEKIDNSSADSYGRDTTYLAIGGQDRWYITTGIDGATVDYRNYIRTGVVTGHLDTGLGGPPYSYRDQAGYTYEATTNELTGPYTKYHFFGGQEGLEGNYAYCVVETTVGLFAHFGIGQLDRIGSLRCPFAICTYWNMSSSYWRSVSSNRHSRMFDGWSTYYGSRPHLRIEQENDPGAYLFGYDGNHCYGGSGAGLNSYIISDGPNAFNGRTMLMPNHVYCNDRGDPDWMRLVGIAPAFRSLRIDNLQPEDIVDTDWMIFPIKAKNSAAGPNSGNYGFAYKFQ